MIQKSLCSLYQTRFTLHYAPKTSKMQSFSLESFVIWSYYRHCSFTWNQILVNSNGPKMSFLALEVHNFVFDKFEQLSSPKFSKNSKFRVSKITENNNFGQIKLQIHQNFISRKIWVTVKWSNFNKVKP